MSYPFMRKKKFCPRRSYHVLPTSKNGSFYTGKSKTFTKNFQDIPRHIIPSHLSWTKNFQDIYIFLKFLSKTLLSCPTLTYIRDWGVRKYLVLYEATRRENEVLSNKPIFIFNFCDFFTTTWFRPRNFFMIFTMQVISNFFLPTCKKGL